MDKNICIRLQADAKQIMDLVSGNRAVLLDLIEALLFIAESDGAVHPKEKEFIETVARIFKFSDTEIEKILWRHISGDPDNPYTVLGVDPSVSDEELKSVWRTLVREAHPDRLMAEGVPADLISVANRRAAEINVAYNMIMTSRKNEKGQKP